ncbi:MAG: GNAT family N-acetyltransferase [Bacteroidota bacterium]|jgi:GNAT superfamily N-acetyltransferase
MTTRELNGKEEMLKHIEVLQELYPTLTVESYASDLDNMLPHNYGQVAVFDGNLCVGISGYWLGTKLWCGRYLELDNIVVRKDYRSKGVGQLIFDYLSEKAVSENCNMMSLDSYTTNYKAHKFFYNNYFAPKGFHFIRILEEDNIR